jgi:hypothetical protein
MDGCEFMTPQAMRAPAPSRTLAKSPVVDMMSPERQRLNAVLVGQS